MKKRPVKKAKPTLKKLLLTDVGRGELSIPPRRRFRWRKLKRMS
jgi:hypothetical protein